MIGNWKPARRPSGTPLTTLRRKSGPIGGMIVIAATLLGGGWAIALGWDKNNPGDLPAFAALLVAVLRLMWRAVVRPHVTVYSDALLVIGFWDRCVVPGAAVRRINLDDGMRIETIHGDDIPVFAFSRSLLDRGQAASAASKMRRAKPARPGTSAETPQVTRTPDFTWADLLFLPLPVLMLLAATGIYGTWS